MNVPTSIYTKRDSFLADQKVKEALAYLEAHLADSVEEQKELTLIEAPTFHEEKRAAAIAEKMKAIGLLDVTIDQHGNAYGHVKGNGKGKPIVIEAHMDTVFPFGSATKIVEKDGRLYAPGIRDNTRGVAIVLCLARAVVAGQFSLDRDLYFLTTVCEEGKGGMKGMTGFVEDHLDDIGGYVCIDGNGDSAVTYEATGMHTLAVNFHGVGGHAYSVFGEVANPLHAAARAVAKISDLQVPKVPKTTFAVTNFHSGNEEGIHAIVNTATIKLNFRSNGNAELQALKTAIMTAIEEACAEETVRWGKDTITYDIVYYIEDDAGTQKADTPLIQSAYSAIEAMGISPSLSEGGSTNASCSIVKGIPTICLGCGGITGGVHTLGEWFDPTGAEKAMQIVLLTALMATGVEGAGESIFE